MHKVQARLTRRTRGAQGFVSQPEPKSIGHFARGKQLVAGNLLFAGHLIQSVTESPWDIAPPDDQWVDELHGFMWLDDLAAVGDARARFLAASWFNSWIAHYGKGRGPGWTPELTGRRLIRLINHAMFVLRGQDKAASDAYYQSLAHQAAFLARRWPASIDGLPRFEALSGMIYAGLSLMGMDRHVDPAIRALEQQCKTQIGSDGSVASRNPEELLDILTLLNWTIDALNAAQRDVPAALSDAVERIAPSLRALRHADGGLARFHGGGRGLDGWLDTALSASEVKTGREPGMSMGYARLIAGRSTLIADAAPPATGLDSFDSHASTLAFELTSGRRPMIVNCGAGHTFGEVWRRAGRATPSHSTLCIEGYSSSRLAPPKLFSGISREALDDVPQNVSSSITEAVDSLRLELFHDGYQANFGLTHGRTLELSNDGRAVIGEDYLASIAEDEKKRFDLAFDRSGLQGIPYTIRFHLHPEVDVSLDLGGAAVSFALKSGEIWVFRHDGTTEMRVEPSVYLENGRLRPRATQQVVLSGRAMSYASRVRWSLSKAHDTPNNLRDLSLDKGAEDDLDAT